MSVYICSAMSKMCPYPLKLKSEQNFCAAMTPQGQGMILILFCFISNLIHVQLFHVPHKKKKGQSSRSFYGEAFKKPRITEG